MDNARALVITVVLLVHGALAVGIGGGPVRAVLRWTGTGQSWAMFAVPDRTPRTLEIHAEVDGDWVPVFVKNVVDHPVIGPRVRDRRIRALYDSAPESGSPGWWNFSRWVGRLALQGEPRATRVRVRVVEGVTTDPWLPADPTATVLLERIHGRAALLAEDGL